MSAHLQIIMQEYIGEGGISNVYRGTDSETGRVMAVKQSRAPLRLKKTLLEYEAQVISILQGHPSIPALYGHGRFPHFEFLALEECKASIQKVRASEKGRTNINTVLQVADQMLLALEHIHSLGFIHRDIKPENIMVSISDPTRLVLVDYNLACVKSATKKTDPEGSNTRVPGTLKWLSLNVHRGFSASYRDDLESLSFTLFYLLRGSLPWDSLHIYVTYLGKMFQTRKLKEKWPGSRLGHEFPTCFGQFLDLLRTLDPDTIPPYKQLQEIIREERSRRGFLGPTCSLDWTPVGEPIKASTEPEPEVLPLKLVAGQIVSITILEEMSIWSVLPYDEMWPEMRPNCNESTTLPGVILKTFVDKRRLQYAYVAPLRYGPTSGICHHILCQKTKPSWPHENLYCYAHPTIFACSVGEARWDKSKPDYRVAPSFLQVLHKCFCKKSQMSNDDQEAWDKIKSLDHIDRFPMVASVKVLTPDDHSSLDWTSDRGWFDPFIRIGRQRTAQNGWKWEQLGSDLADDRSENSYVYPGWDYIQSERDPSLTVSGWLPPSDSFQRQPIECIPKISSIHWETAEVAP